MGEFFLGLEGFCERLLDSDTSLHGEGLISPSLAMVSLSKAQTTPDEKCVRDLPEAYHNIDRALPQIVSRHYAHLTQLGLGHTTDIGQLANRQIAHKAKDQISVGWQVGLPIGLVPIGANLGKHAVRGNPCATCELCSFVYPCSYLVSNLLPTQVCVHRFSSKVVSHVEVDLIQPL